MIFYRQTDGRPVDIDLEQIETIEVSGDGEHAILGRSEGGRPPKLMYSIQNSTELQALVGKMVLQSTLRNGTKIYGKTRKPE